MEKAGEGGGGGGGEDSVSSLPQKTIKDSRVNRDITEVKVSIWPVGFLQF